MKDFPEELGSPMIPDGNHWTPIPPSPHQRDAGGIRQAGDFGHELHPDASAMSKALIAGGRNPSETLFSQLK